jgi:fatty acid amide hydrolase
MPALHGSRSCSWSRCESECAFGARRVNASGVSLHDQSAIELRTALAKKHVSSVEIVRAFIARRDAVGRRTNAIVVTMDEAALAAAAASDARRARGELRGPLDGLPITAKENIDVEGTPGTLGVESRRGYRAKEDAVTVRLLRAAGAIVIGKTNVPQTLIAMETTSHVYGTCNNPWAHERTPGGSSGGEAAAIASGQSVLGIGTDIGGSVRIPAAYTATFALKPTLHRWSNRGSIGLLAGQEIVRSQIGPMARSTDDLAMLYGSIDTPLHAQLDPECPPLPMRDPQAVDVRALRIGVYESDGWVTPCATSQRAVREAAEILRRAGATIVEFTPPRASEHYLVMAAGLSADGMHTMNAALGNDPVIPPLALNRRLGASPRSITRNLARVARLAGEKRLADILGVAGEKSVAELWGIARERTAMQRTELDAWNEQQLDLVLCPATATAAPQHGVTGDFTAAAVYTTRYNLLNLPAGVVPLTRVRPNETDRPEKADRLDKKAAHIQRGSAGMPIGVQIVGRPWREDVVLSGMRAVEAEARRSSEFPSVPIDG